MIGDPPGDTHWRRNLDAVMDGKQLLAIGTAPAYEMPVLSQAISTPYWLWRRQHHADILSASSSHRNIFVKQ